MISFSRIENTVKVKVQHGIFHNDAHFALTINQDYEYQAQLLLNQLDKHLRNNLEAIRKEAYEQGWKDAKAKRKKKTWFSSWWK